MPRITLPDATIEVKVTPRASRGRVVVTDGQIKVYVTAAPADGEANRAVIAVLASALRIAPSKVSIISGHQSRTKKIQILGMTSEEVFSILTSRSE